MSNCKINKQKSKTHHNKKETNRKCNIKQKLNYLKIQILALKQIHQNVMKLVSKICQIIPQEILYFWDMGCCQKYKEDKELFNKPKQQNHHINNKLAQIDSQKKGSQLKIQDFRYTDIAIKNEISQQLKVLKMLQNKQKELRVQNQKQQKFRRSLSKQSILKNCLKQISNHPKYNESLRSNKINNSFSMIQNTIQSNNNSLQTSPTFGSTQFNKIQSFQSSNINRQYHLSTSKVAIQTLRCPNKHQYYKGQLFNHLPHGKGALIVCCQKIPVKINTKTLRYYGNFQNGVFEGKGVLFCKGNIKFEGTFVKGKRSGEGVINLDGKSERGIWQNDKLISFI